MASRAGSSELTSNGARQGPLPLSTPLPLRTETFGRGTPANGRLLLYFGAGALAGASYWHGAEVSEEKSLPFCGTAGTTGERDWILRRSPLFTRASAEKSLGSLSAKPGVLRQQNPGICAARRAAIGRLLKRLSRFGRKQKPAGF